MAAGMYSMKPYYEPGKNVEKPDVMYSMKNYHTKGDSSSVSVLT